MKHLLLASLLSSLALTANAQTSGAPTFDVSSVKPSDGSVGTNMRTYPNRLLATDFTLGQLIQVAFSLESWQVEGGPPWMNRDKFDIEAKAGEALSPNSANTVTTGGAVAPHQMMLMLQALLAERFSLSVRRETRQENVYSLVTANASQGLETPRDRSASFVGTSRGGPPPSSIIQGHNASMEQFAHYLSGIIGRPVTNQTGLSGNYDFRVEYAPDESSDANAPGLTTALKNTLGLKLSATKGPVEFLVVGHADKPSPN